MSKATVKDVYLYEAGLRDGREEALDDAIEAVMKMPDKRFCDKWGSLGITRKMAIAAIEKLRSKK
jgi:hypothetical protein